MHTQVQSHEQASVLTRILLMMCEQTHSCGQQCGNSGDLSLGISYFMIQSITAVRIDCRQTNKQTGKLEHKGKATGRANSSSAEPMTAVFVGGPGLLMAV